MRRAAAAGLVALALITACARPGSSGAPVAPAAESGAAPVAAGDGALWYVHGGELVRLDAHGTTRRFGLGAGAQQQMAVVRSGADTVWFVAISIPSAGAVTTVVGRAGPGGVLSRARLPSTATIDPGAVGSARDGALWAHEILAPPAGGRVDQVLRVGADGTMRSIGGFIAGAIVPGAGGTVWVATQDAVAHLGPGGALSSWPLPSFPSLVPRPDGGVGFAVPARGRDMCLAGAASDAGLELDQSRPLIDNTARPALYSGAYGCFETYAGAEGSLWDVVRPEQYGHGGALARGPWDVYRVGPDGSRRQWTLPSGDSVAAMAPAPRDAMWFLSGDRHALGVITAAGSVEEGVQPAPDPGGAIPRLIPTGGGTLYLVTGTSVRVVHVPPR